MMSKRMRPSKMGKTASKVVNKRKKVEQKAEVQIPAKVEVITEPADSEKLREETKSVSKGESSSDVSKALYKKPKRNITSYAFFIKEKKKEFGKAKSKDKMATILMKEFGKQWSNLSESERKPFDDLALKDKERYDRELADFSEKCGDQSLLKELESKRPKKALSAYMIFVREMRAKVCSQNPGMHALQVMKEVGKLWQNLSPVDRKEYDLLADKDKIRFQNEIEDFNRAVESIQNSNKGKSQPTSPATSSKVINKGVNGATPGKGKDVSKKANSKLSASSPLPTVKVDQSVKIPEKEKEAFEKYCEQVYKSGTKRRGKSQVSKQMEQMKLQWMSLTDSQKGAYMSKSQTSPKTSLHAQNSCKSQAGIQHTPEFSGIKNTPTEDEVLGECKLGEKECSDVQTTRDEGMSPLKQEPQTFIVSKHVLKDSYNDSEIASTLRRNMVCKDTKQPNNMSNSLRESESKLYSKTGGARYVQRVPSFDNSRRVSDEAVRIETRRDSGNHPAELSRNETNRDFDEDFDSLFFHHQESNWSQNGPNTSALDERFDQLLGWMVSDYACSTYI